VSTINENVALTKPVIEWEINTVNKRPELQLFDLQSEQIKSQNTISKSNLPKVNAFAQAGYETGLNMLDNSFQTFTCSKAHWNVFDWDKSKKKKRHYSFLRPS
jgi:hypothetical protein